MTAALRSFAWRTLETKNFTRETMSPNCLAPTWPNPRCSSWRSSIKSACGLAKRRPCASRASPTKLFWKPPIAAPLASLCFPARLWRISKTPECVKERCCNWFVAASPIAKRRKSSDFAVAAGPTSRYSAATPAAEFFPRPYLFLPNNPSLIVHHLWLVSLPWVAQALACVRLPFESHSWGRCLLRTSACPECLAEERNALSLRFVEMHPSAFLRARVRARFFTLTQEAQPCRSSLERKRGLRSLCGYSRIFVGRGFSHDISPAISVRL